jgi:hypothetical protein
MKSFHVGVRWLLTLTEDILMFLLTGIHPVVPFLTCLHRDSHSL